jgi:hypothetical protein
VRFVVCSIVIALLSANPGHSRTNKTPTNTQILSGFFNAVAKQNESSAQQFLSSNVRIFRKDDMKLGDFLSEMKNCRVRKINDSWKDYSSGKMVSGTRIRCSDPAIDGFVETKVASGKISEIKFYYFSLGVFEQ